MATEQGGEIDYPCSWSYTVIGRAEATLRAAIAEVIAVERCTITTGRSSSGGRYTSLTVELEVQSAEERNRFYAGLQGHPGTAYVL